MLSLKTMTESKLKVLKREVEAALQAKVAARRQEIESELSRLPLLDGGGRPKVVRAAAKGMAAAKYRKPASASKAAGRKLEGGEHGLMDLLGGPAADGVGAVEQHLQQTDDPRVVDFDAGITHRADGEG